MGGSIENAQMWRASFDDENEEKACEGKRDNY